MSKQIPVHDKAVAEYRRAPKISKNVMLYRGSIEPGVRIESPDGDGFVKINKVSYNTMNGQTYVYYSWYNFGNQGYPDGSDTVGVRVEDWIRLNLPQLGLSI